MSMVAASSESLGFRVSDRDVQTQTDLPCVKWLKVADQLGVLKGADSRSSGSCPQCGVLIVDQGDALAGDAPPQPPGLGRPSCGWSQGLRSTLGREPRGQVALRACDSHQHGTSSMGPQAPHSLVCSRHQLCRTWLLKAAKLAAEVQAARPHSSHLARPQVQLPAHAGLGPRQLLLLHTSRRSAPPQQIEMSHRHEAPAWASWVRTASGRAWTRARAALQVCPRRCTPARRRCGTEKPCRGSDSRRSGSLSGSAPRQVSRCS